MADDRSLTIKIGDKEYELLLTTKATKEISKKYGGLDKLGEHLQNKKTDEQLEDIVWIITLLANQPILINNLKNPDGKKDLLTEEQVEILTTPQELSSFTEAITKTFKKGLERNIVSEPSKNV